MKSEKKLDEREPKPPIEKDPGRKPIPEKDPPNPNSPYEAPTDPDTEKKKEIRLT